VTICIEFEGCVFERKALKLGHYDESFATPRICRCMCLEEATIVNLYGNFLAKPGRNRAVETQYAKLASLLSRFLQILLI
jgi:hypothetical protein